MTACVVLHQNGCEELQSGAGIEPRELARSTGDIDRNAIPHKALKCFTHRLWPFMSDSLSPVILVVDDFPTVLSATTMRLRRAGFSVVEAMSGEEALAILEGRNDVSVILSDCNMPGMSGSDLARAVLSRWPHIGFVATSGKPRAPDLPPEVAFIAKPVRIAALVAVVTSMLPGHPSSVAV